MKNCSKQLDLGIYKTMAPLSRQRPGSVSLSKIFFRNLCIAEIALLMRISSWNCARAQSHALGTRTKFQLEILIINVNSGIVYFREIIMESSWNVVKHIRMEPRGGYDEIRKINRSWPKINRFCLWPGYNSMQFFSTCPLENARKRPTWLVSLYQKIQQTLTKI